MTVIWTLHLAGSYQTLLSRDSSHLNLGGLVSCKSCMYLSMLFHLVFVKLAILFFWNCSHFLDRYLDH